MCGLKKNTHKKIFECNFDCAAFPGNGYRNCVCREQLQREEEEGGEAQQTWILRDHVQLLPLQLLRALWLSLHVASKAPHITNVFHDGLSASHHAQVPSSHFSPLKEFVRAQ